MATFKEIAEFILNQSEDFQNSEANFMDVFTDEFDEIDGESVTLSRKKIQIVNVVDRQFAPMIFGVPMGYQAIAVTDDDTEIQELEKYG